MNPQISEPMPEKKRGWRTIATAERIEAANRIESIPEDTERHIRDKAILKYFVVENMSALRISKLGDPRIVCFSNRAKGKPMTYTSILDVIYMYFPQWKGRNQSRKKDTQRLRLMKKRRTQKSPHIKQCAFCGSKEKLEEHHMIPVFLGGTNDDANLVYLCHDHHKEVTRYQRQLEKGIA